MFRVCRHATCRVCSARVVYKIEKAVCRSSVYKCDAWTVRMPRPLNPGHHRLNAAASGDVGLNWSGSSYKCAPAPPPPLSEKLGQGNKKAWEEKKTTSLFFFCSFTHFMGPSRVWRGCFGAKNQVLFEMEPALLVKLSFVDLSPGPCILKQNLKSNR